MSDDHQTTGKTETVSRTGHGAFIGEVFGNFLEPAADNSIEGLQKKYGFTEAVDQLPGRIVAGEMGQLVGEEALLVFDGEIADPFGATDLGPPDTGGKRHRYSSRGAELNCLAKTHCGGQAFDEPSRRSHSAGPQKPFEIEDGTAEDQQCHQRADSPQQQDGAGQQVVHSAVGCWNWSCRGDEQSGLVCRVANRRIDFWV